MLASSQANGTNSTMFNPYVRNILDPVPLAFGDAMVEPLFKYRIEKSETKS